MYFAPKYATLRAGVEWKVGSTIVGTVAEAPSSQKETNVSCSAVEQEICYNFGRIYQQAGLVHLAVEYYERGLAAQHPLIDEHEEYLGLRQEIAYNLHLIYKAAGNLRKARQYLYEYCVV
uniref:General transcription factor 3C polypeptide 3 n=1 Tax=Bactrocera dorsalis TaxID=27457 RepID=A0A034W1B9_BACDO